jgi:ankyrin repeat protein
VDAIRVLVELGADIEAKDNVRWFGLQMPAYCHLTRVHAQSEYTPLANAACNGNVDAIRALVELGADLEAKTVVRSMCSTI